MNIYGRGIPRNLIDLDLFAGQRERDRSVKGAEFGIYSAGSNAFSFKFF